MKLNIAILACICIALLLRFGFARFDVSVPAGAGWRRAISLHAKLFWVLMSTAAGLLFIKLSAYLARPTR